MTDFKSKIISSEKFYNESFLNFDYKLTEYNYHTLKEYFKKGIGLELGPALGHMTKFLINNFDTLHLVEGSKSLLSQIPDYSNVVKHHAFFEEFKSDLKFDTIIMSHVLEHIEKPVEVLKTVRNLLKPDGVFILSVPNAKSFHRLAAVEMGLLKNEYELNQRDHELGHYRVYDLPLLKKDAIEADMKVIAEGGVFFKPLSNSQIEKNWSPEMIDGFYKLGKKFPDNCAEIFIVCQL